jgi:alpha,alpha-trehalase
MTWLHALLFIPIKEIDFIFTLLALLSGSIFFLFSYLAQEEQLKPQEQYPELFKAVQSQGIFPDSKTFPDCIPVLAPELIRVRAAKF